ncbi:uncharacterized protein BO95DRAFT_207339 [Aspergillus brunneoviolaceus CBS 621.78]|uniref:Uncharacterized protein n=1 Tax=Aspergillus brunneoviolaceus CBS 621.78 TaxID=1450534 RepID=A0ACD1G2N3_9EURO|nr:hypothetical protein BO95DRAFT_207339 [Aspergillus brunneoviolaceus CBS 621.78]RAH43500.1 hypothetical protein BO95DRAFT_207339 [Aspergillus brunneoviolaceus CBS 621.78]
MRVYRCEQIVEILYSLIFSSPNLTLLFLITLECHLEWETSRPRRCLLCSTNVTRDKPHRLPANPVVTSGVTALPPYVGRQWSQPSPPTDPTGPIYSSSPVKYPESLPSLS